MTVGDGYVAEEHIYRPKGLDVAIETFVERLKTHGKRVAVTASKAIMPYGSPCFFSHRPRV